MHWSIWIIVFAVLFGIGFTAGFYMSNFFQKQIQVLIGAAVVLAILTWIGSATDLLGLLRDWLKEKREEEKTPTLLFDGFYKTPTISMHTDTEKINYTYFIVVKKNSGEGYVKDCEGFITVDGTTINNAPTVWTHADARRYDIGGQMGLRLFTIDPNDKIIFASAFLEQGFKPNGQPLNDFINKEIIIEIHAARGRVPNPKSIKIRDIINELDKK
jgi:hypothetical protein